MVSAVGEEGRMPPDGIHHAVAMGTFSSARQPLAATARPSSDGVAMPM